MEKQIVTVHAGTLQIPADLQHKLGLENGTRLTVSVQDGAILFAPEAGASDSEAALEAIQELDGMFAGGHEMTDELRKLRLEWEQRLEKLSA